jgi:hypothetical protein
MKLTWEDACNSGGALVLVRPFLRDGELGDLSFESSEPRVA